MMSSQWARKKRTDNQGLLTIDIILFLVILICLVGIANLLLEPTQKSREITQIEAAPPQPPPNLNSPTPDSETVPVATSDAWKQIMTDPALRAARTLRSEACSSSFEPLQWGLHTSHPDRIRQIRAHLPQVIAVTNEDFCFELGQQIQIVTFGRLPEAPVIAHLATMSVFDILQFENGITPSALQAFAMASLGSILRLEPATLEAQNEVLVPPVAQHGKIIFKNQREAFFKKYPNALVVDIRNPREFAEGTFPGAINVPFLIAPRSSSSFSWDVLNKDIVDTKFDIQQIERLAAGKPIVILGGPPSDGRAFWAIHLLSDLSIRKLFYFYEGL